MENNEKVIIAHLVKLLKSTLGSMQPKEADEVVRNVAAILESL